MSMKELSNSSVIIVAISIAMILFIGCHRLVLWNPVYKSADLEGEVSLHMKGIGIKISKFGFVNARHNPEAHVQIKNFIYESVSFDFSQCRLSINSQTINPNEMKEPLVILKRGESAKRLVRFEYHLSFGKIHDIDGKQYAVPEPTAANLILGKAITTDGEILLPVINYASDVNKLYRTKFI